MQRDLPKAAALLPAQLSFDAIGYCCTSGATMIGEDNVMEVLWLAMVSFHRAFNRAREQVKRWPIGS